MLSNASVEQPTHEPALAAARVVASAIELARAEAQLVFAHARTALLRTVGAVLAGMVASSAAQAVLVLWALSPALFPSWSRSAVVVALLPSACLCALGTVLTLFALRSLQAFPVTAPVVTR